jgi:IS1 family transposase
MTIRLRFFLIVLCAVASDSIRAELPPWVYKERQEKAPEALVIKVKSVNIRETTEANWKQTEFTVKAEVQKVERSATKLVAGATIEIRTASVITRHRSWALVKFRR